MIRISNTLLEAMVKDLELVQEDFFSENTQNLIDEAKKYLINDLESIRLTLPIYYNKNKSKQVLAGLNWYRNVNFHLNNAIKKFIAGIIDESIDGEPIMDGKIHVHYDIYFKRKGTDGGNVRSVMEKFALDGIKAANMISDDTFEIIVSSSDEYFYDKEHPRIEIKLTRVLTK